LTKYPFRIRYKQASATRVGNDLTGGRYVVLSKKFLKGVNAND